MDENKGGQNPYETSRDVEVKQRCVSSSRQRSIAMAFLVLPFFVAVPIVYACADATWVVRENVSGRAELAALFTSWIVISVCIISWFVSMLLFWLDRRKLLVTGCMALMLGVLSIPALFFLVVAVRSWVEYG